MLRFLPVLLMLALTLYAVIDCIARDDDEIRGLPKIVWVLIILVFPPLGGLAWFIAGRPRGAALPRPSSPFTSAAPPARPMAPDDDPEFLKRLDEQRRRPHTED